MLLREFNKSVKNDMDNDSLVLDEIEQKDDGRVVVKLTNQSDNKKMRLILINGHTESQSFDTGSKITLDSASVRYERSFYAVHEFVCRSVTLSNADNERLVLTSQEV